MPAATTVRDAAKALLHALDPVAFARDRLGFDPDRWQADLLASAARWTLVNCSRQAGKSTTAGVLALHVAVHRPGALVLLLSPSLRQSGELFRKFAEMRDRLRPKPELVESNATSCTLANGARVVSLPGAEATVRGYSAPALVVEDEASRVSDPLYRAIRPMLATAPSGRLILLSTPYGQRGHFWEEWSAGGPDWRRVEVRAGEVARIPAEFLAAERRALGDAWYRQEYGCEFLASADAIFDPADILRAMAGTAEPLFPSGLAPEPGRAVPLFPGN